MRLELCEGCAWTENDGFVPLFAQVGQQPPERAGDTVDLVVG